MDLLEVPRKIDAFATDVATDVAIYRRLPLMLYYIL